MAAQGGTELLKKWLFQNIDTRLLENVNIVSRPEDMSDKDNNVLWVHDLPADMPFLASAKERQRFRGIVFVSSWQQTVFFMNMGVPYSDSTVIRNAIYPITPGEKRRDGQIRLIYHPTPHRGLELLVPVFNKLCEKYDNLHLDVFSSFDLYDRPEANEPYNALYDACRAHPKISYHGTQPNDVVRAALAEADIFAYPCIWRETSCISAMEAMSARCLVIAPEYAALPETLSGFNFGYNWTERLEDHARRFATVLERAIEATNARETDELLDAQKLHVDRFYSWSARAAQWETYLGSVLEVRQVRRSGLQWN